MTDAPVPTADPALCVVAQRCEVCHRENVPLQQTRGWDIFIPPYYVQRCVDGVACFAAFRAALAPDAGPDGDRAASIESEDENE